MSKQIYWDLCIIDASIIKVKGDKFWQINLLDCSCADEPDVIRCSNDFENETNFKANIKFIIEDSNGNIQLQINKITKKIVDKYLKNEQNKLDINIPTALSGLIQSYTTISLQTIYHDIYNQKNLVDIPSFVCLPSTPTDNDDSE